MFYAILFFKLTGTTVVEYVQVSHADVHIIIFSSLLSRLLKGASSKQYNPSFHLRYSYEGKVVFLYFPLYDPKIRLLSTG